MKKRVCSVQEVVNEFMLPGTRIVYPGFAASTYPMEIMGRIRSDFDAKGSPRDLKFVVGGGNHMSNIFGVDGIIGELTIGHYGHLGVDVRKLVSDERMVSYNYPQGVVGHMLRARANGQKGLLTKIGLGTYMDPRIEGGKMNASTTEDRIHLVELDGEEYLYYECPQLDIAMIRATAVDEYGNVSMADEMYTGFAKDAILATKACGGIVIVECREYVQGNSIQARDVFIPGSLVDIIVPMENPTVSASQWEDKFYDPTYQGILRPSGSTMVQKELDARLLIGRRAAMELPPHAVLNMGIGVPDNVSATASMEGCIDDVVFTLEAGVIGGEAFEGRFGIQVNQSCQQDEPTQFDFFHAGLLDIAFLGVAEVDKDGNVNSSKFNGMVNGCGGFIDIAQPTPKVVFCTTFTAGGLREHVEDGKLVIDVEGRNPKFIEAVQQVSFSAKTAVANGQDITFVTERAVFKLTDQGLMLTEIAPGIDLQKDVLDKMGFAPIVSDDLKLMYDKLFYDQTFGLDKIIQQKAV